MKIARIHARYKPIFLFLSHDISLGVIPYPFNLPSYDKHLPVGSTFSGWKYFDNLEAGRCGNLPNSKLVKERYRLESIPLFSLVVRLRLRMLCFIESLMNHRYRWLTSFCPRLQTRRGCQYRQRLNELVFLCCATFHASSIFTRDLVNLGGWFTVPPNSVAFNSVRVNFHKLLWFLLRRLHGSPNSIPENDLCLFMAFVQIQCLLLGCIYILCRGQTF